MPRPTRIATWNINSVRLRQTLVERLISEAAPDVLCLQETKCPDDKFPAEAFATLGYKHQALAGMMAYNGVAILSRVPFEHEERLLWCGKEDCRHIAVTIPGGTEIHNFYVPAGGDEPDPEVNDKFAHKLQFLAEMEQWFVVNRSADAPMVLVGDLNIAPLETDVWSHKQLLKVVSHTPIEVEALGRVQGTLGWVDTVRQDQGDEHKLYSWWSYRARDWDAADKGRRLDHIWVTPVLADAIVKTEILRPVRGWDPKPSDHVPVFAEITLPA